MGVKELNNLPEVKANETVLLKQAGAFNFLKKLMYPSGTINKIIYKFPLLRRVLKTFRTFVIESVFSALKKDAKYKKMTATERDYLVKMYKQDVTELKQILGFTFDEWQEFK